MRHIIWIVICLIFWYAIVPLAVLTVAYFAFTRFLAWAATD
jgi:hypothetical protein